jgi:hypothetical protein
MATCSKSTEILESNENEKEVEISLPSQPLSSPTQNDAGVNDAITLTQEQIDRIEKNRKRALELRQSKQSQEKPAKMFESLIFYR